MAASDHLGSQFGKQRDPDLGVALHRYDGPTKAVSVVGSRAAGSPIIGAAEVHPDRKGPVRAAYAPRHAKPGPPDRG